jgi:hypothetical protein
MRKHRQTAPGAARQLGRVGALGIVASGALCAAVLSVTSRVPPSPLEQSTIPGIQIGSDTPGDVTRSDRKAAGRKSSGRGARASRYGARGPSRGGRASRRSGAVAVAYGGVRGPGAQSGGGAPGRLDRDTGPGGGTRDGTSWGGGGGGSPPGTAVPRGEARRRPGRAAPAPVPAPPPAPVAAPTSNGAPDDDPAPPGTAVTANEEEVEADADAVDAPAAAAPTPEADPAGDSDDG